MNLAHVACLALFRARPVRPLGVLAGWAGATALALWMTPSAPPPPTPAVSPIMIVRLTAVVMGICIAFVGGREVDVAENVARSLPSPYWRTLALRCAGWTALGCIAVLLVAQRAAPALAVGAGPVVNMGLVFFVLSVALAFAASRAWGSLIGGAMAIGAVAAATIASMLTDRFPLHLMGDPTQPAWAHTAWTTWAIGVLMFTAVLISVARTGSRGGSVPSDPSDAA